MAAWKNILDLPLRPSNSYHGGNVWNRPKYPLIPVETLSREHDLTLSLGRNTNHDEIEKLLFDSGCIVQGQLADYANQIRITGNKENGQIFVELKPGLSDVFAEKLNTCNLPGFVIDNCHTYTRKDVLVRFSAIHSSVDIKTEIVDNFLSHYGEVKNWFPVKHPRLKIPIGPWNFVMKAEDLARNPLPESAFLGNSKNQVWISYDSQVKKCHQCGSEEHLSRACPKSFQNPSSIRRGICICSWYKSLYH